MRNWNSLRNALLRYIYVSFPVRASIKCKIGRLDSRGGDMNFPFRCAINFPTNSDISELSKSLNWFARFEVGRLVREKKKKKKKDSAIKPGARFAAEAQLQLTRAANFAAAAATALTMMKFDPGMTVRTLCLLFFLARYGDGDDGARGKILSTRDREDKNYCRICPNHTMCMFPVNIYRKCLGNDIILYTCTFDRLE